MLLTSEQTWPNRMSCWVIGAFFKTASQVFGLYLFYFCLPAGISVSRIPTDTSIQIRIFFSTLAICLKSTCTSVGLGFLLITTVLKPFLPFPQRDWSTWGQDESYGFMFYDSTDKAGRSTPVRGFGMLFPLTVRAERMEGASGTTHKSREVRGKMTAQREGHLLWRPFGLGLHCGVSWLKLLQ